MNKVQFVLRIKSDLNIKLIQIANCKEISKNALINQVLKEYAFNVENSKHNSRINR